MNIQRLAQPSNDPMADRTGTLESGRVARGEIERFERMASAQRATLSAMSRAISRQRRHVEALRARVSGGMAQRDGDAAVRLHGHRGGRIVVAALLGIAMFGVQGTAVAAGSRDGAAVTAYSTPRGGVAFARTRTVRDYRLAEMRGGFSLPNGMSINIGARLDTLRDGILHLSTRFNFDNPANSTVAMLQDGTLVEQAVDGTNGITTSVGDADTALITHSVDTNGLSASIQNRLSHTGFQTDLTLQVSIDNLGLKNTIQSGRQHRIANLMNTSLIGALPQ